MYTCISNLRYTFTAMVWIKIHNNFYCRYIYSQKCIGGQHYWQSQHWLTHWGRVTHICVGKLTIIGSDNGLSPGRRQAIIWTNAGILLIGPLRTNFSEILSEINSFSFKKMRLKMSSGKWRPSCLGLNVLMKWLEAEQMTSHRQYITNVQW